MAKRAASPLADAQLVADVEELARRRREVALSYYRAYPKQAEFHQLGADRRERLFLAGNQLGKTTAGAMELAMHLTGRYPAWWPGRRFTGPVRVWAASDTATTTRDGPQRLLLGVAGQQLGTGALPRETLTDTRMSRSTPDAVDTAFVKHAAGGYSQLTFKSYEAGRQKWQGETLDAVWFDEEPPVDVFSEGLARITARRGFVFITATPLLGLSSVVLRYLGERSPDRGLVQMAIEDAGHIPPAERERIIAGYAEHERDARTRGVPMLGSGAVFPIAETLIRCDPIEIPRWWPQLGALDFGWDHPTAAVRIAWDRDADCVYVMSCYRVAKQTPVVHAGALRAWGEWLPWAWPHDGAQHSKDSGAPLAEQYRRQGLRMLQDYAQYDDSRGNALEASLMDILSRMETQRLKVFTTCSEWFEEFRGYYRKDGRPVAERDDLLSATRDALTSLRFARNGASALARGQVFQAKTDFNVFAPEPRA